MKNQKLLGNRQAAWQVRFSPFFSPFLLAPVIAFWMLASFSAGAQNYVFTGASGVNFEWSNPNNWDANGYPGIVISAGQSASIQANCILDTNVINNGNITIEAGMSLTIHFSKTLTNNGMLLNNDSLNITNTGILNNEITGVFDNEGVVELNGTLNNLGAFDNHDTLNVNTEGDFFNTDGTFNNHAVLTNNGMVDNKSGGSFTNLSGATLNHNTGQFLTEDAGSLTSNAGTFNCAAYFDVFDSGAFSNSASFSNTASIDVNGQFTNAAGGTLTNSDSLHIGSAGSLTNNGTLTNSTAGVLTDNGLLTNNNILNNLATATLSVGAGKTLENNDTLNNHNVFNVNGICKTNTGATTTNHANLTVGTTGQFIVDGGTVANNSTLTNNGYVEIKNSGTLNSPSGSSITNNDQVVILNNGGLTNGGSFSSSDYVSLDPGSTFTNSGSVTNTNSFEVNGNFTNQGGATVSNTGNLHIGSPGSITNNGTFTNLTSGILNNTGAFTNNFNLINDDATLLIGAGKTLNNNDSLYNNGVVTVHGTLKNNLLSVLVNDSTVTVSGSGTLVVDSAILNNNLLITNSGSFEAKNHAAVNNPAGATITNSGSVQIASFSILTNQNLVSNSGYFVVMTNGVMNNHDTLTNTGDFDLNATLNNFASSVVNNSSNFHNTSAGNLLNNGTVNNLAGTFTQNGIFNNNELFDNDATLLIGAGKIMNNNDSLYNNGVVTLHGTLKNNVNSTLTNDSTVTVSGSGTLVVDSAILNNNLLITSSGNFEAKNHAAVNNPAAATITSSGSVQIASFSILTNQNLVSNSGYFVVMTNGVMNNYDTLSNTGDFDLNATLNNFASGVVSNSSNFHNTSIGNLLNNGTVNNLAGTFTQNGIFNNNELFDNDATLLIGAGKFMNNNDSLYNNGVVTLHGTLNNNIGSALTNDSTVTVSGSGVLVVDSAILNNNALVTSSGSIEAKNTASVNNLAGATLTNNGQTQIASSSILNNEGMVSTSAYFVVMTNGVINNYDTLSNTGDFDINATLNNFPSGVVDNAANFHNTSTGTLLNNGTINNLAGTFTQNGIFNNNLLLDNDATLLIGAGKSMNNNGHVENDGICTFNGTLNNNAGATFDNDSTLTIGASGNFISVNATLTNNDSIACNGNLDIKSSSTFSNTSGAMLTNAGQFQVRDTLTLFTNAGDVNNSNFFSLADNAIFTNSGELTNTSTFEVGATMNNQASGIVTNSATLHITSSGNLTNGGTITNQAAGTLNDTGVFTNNNSVNNAGIFNIGAGKILNNNGLVANSGSVNDNGTFNHNAGGNLTNSGTFTVGSNGKLFVMGSTATNSGTVTVQFLLEIKAGGIFTNQASALLTNNGQVLVFDTLSLLSNAGTIDNFGFVNNFSNGGVTNEGIFNNKSTGSTDNNGFFINMAGDTLQNDGTFNNASSAPMLNHGILLNSMTGIFHNNATLTNNGSLTNNGTVHNNASKTIENNGTLLNSNLLNTTGTVKTTAAGSLTNAAGTINVNSGGNLIAEGSTLTNSALITNQGTVEVKASGSFLNQPGSTLNNLNQVLVNDTSSFSNAATFANLSYVNVESGSTFTNSDTLPNSGSFDAGGTFTNAVGATLTNNTGGIFDVKGGALMTNLNQVTNVAGAIFINSGILIDNDTFTNLGTFTNSGILKGIGVFTTDSLPNSTTGTVAPGLSPGTLTVDGDFSNFGTVQIELGGINPGEYDTLAVTGVANLGATLQVTLVNGFVPVTGNTFTILTADSIADQFAAVNYPSVSGISWTITYLATSVRINAQDALPSCTSLTNPANGATDVPVTTALTWAPATGVVIGYHLNVGTTPGGTEILDNFDVLVTTYDPPGDFPYNATIYVQIIPFNATGDAVGCLEESFTTQTVLPACTSLTSPANGATNVAVTAALTWAAATGFPTGYRLDVGTTSGGTDILNNFDVGNVTTYNPPGDFPYITIIYVKITPYNAAGDASGCTEESFTTQTFLPSCTSLTSPANGATNVAVAAALTWAVPTGIPTGYLLDVGTTSGGTDILNNFDVGNVTTYNPPGDFPYNTIIYVKITPYNGNGSATGCLEESFTTQIAPPACTSLTSPANGATNVAVTEALTWAAATGFPTGYRLNVGTTSGGTDILNNFDAGNVTTYDPPGNLPFGTTIFVKIIPYNATGDASGCSEESFTTQIAPPSCTNLTSPANGATNVAVTAALTWAAATGNPTGYRLNVGTTSGGTDILNNFDVGNVTTFDPPGDFPYITIIYVKITPYNTGGDASGCAEESFTTQTLLPACTSLTSPANGATNVSITTALTWAAATGFPTGYRLDVGTTSGGTDILNNFDVGNVTTYDPAGNFPYNAIIYVKITPYNAAGDASGCSEESFTTQSALPSCTNLTSPANSATNVAVTAVLTWAAATGFPTGYRLDVGTTSGGTDILNNFDVGNVTTYNPPGDFPYNTIIYVKITPYNATGDASGCSEESFTTQIAPPACTSLTSPANGATNVAVTAALTWAAATGSPTGYRLNVGTTSGGTDILNNFDAGNVTTYDPPGNLPFGTTIFVKITPYNATGDASGCSEESFTTQIAPPACTSLTSPANSATNVAVTASLTWVAASGSPTGYRLNVGTTSGGTDILNNFDAGNVTTYDPPGDFPFGTTIFVKITPYNATGDAVGCSEESFTTQIAPPACTSLTNPANGATNVAVTTALTWAAATGSPTGYRLNVGTTSSGTDILNNFDAGNVTTYDPPGNLPFGTTIFVKIIPYNATGDAAGCSEESFTTQIAPPACTSLTSPANGATNVAVTAALTWAAATGSPTGYRLNAGTTSGGTDILNNFDVGNFTTYDPPGDFPFVTTIFVKITPYNATGDASGCSEESFTTQSAVPSCTNLTSPANSATNVPLTAALTWAAASGSPTGYRLDVGTTSGGTNILNNFDVGNVTTYNPPGNFPNNSTIYVKIKPYNAAGSATGCVEESFLTQVCIPNLVIENIVIPSGTYHSQGDLTSNVTTVATGSNVIFKSDTGILLGSVFTVQLGATFDAMIETCPTNFNVIIPGEK